MNARKRTATVLFFVAMLAILSRRPPSLDLTIQMHEANDLAPHQLRAAIDLGLAGISVLYTWSEHPPGL